MQIQNFQKIDGTRGKMCQIWRSISTDMCVQVIPVKLQLQVGEWRHKGLCIVDFTLPNLFHHNQVDFMIQIRTVSIFQNLVKISQIRIADGFRA